tara:strand:+ start:19032 stop:19238 length:207 start_codon:yes stop_codon:yes gene_type:complete
MSATKKRSGMKAITWRLIATLDTFVIAWFITGDSIVAASIITVEVLTKFVFYYFHERAWQTTNWGLEE